MVTDGTAVWIVDDIRDGTPVGAVRGSLYLPAGYIKANGATVNRADYPRLVTLANKYNLWTDNITANAGMFGKGDENSTFVLPNWIDRMAQFANGAGASVAAGLPNITGWSLSDHDFIGGGAFYSSGTQNNLGLKGGTDSDNDRSMFDASRSNPIYGASDTVQPPAIKLIPIIRY